MKPEQTSVFGASLVLLRAASTDWALVRKLQQPDNHFFFTDTISSVLSRLWPLCTSRFTANKRQGDTVLPFHLLLQMPLAGQGRWELLWVQGKADSDDVQGMYQESPVWTRKCLGTSHIVGREGQATGEPQSRDTVKDNVINVTTAAFDYKDSVKIQNRRVKTWSCTGQTPNIPKQPWRPTNLIHSL